MAFKLISQEYCAIQSDNIRSYILDSANDVSDLPQCCAGSTAIVADSDGAMFMMNASGEWKEL